MSRFSPAVQEFCERLWADRECGRLPDAGVLSRRMLLAMAADVAASETYDPFTDRRLTWARELMERRLRSTRYFDIPMASAGAEEYMGWVLGKATVLELSGKDFAAGEAREVEV